MSTTTLVPTGVISNGPEWCMASLIDIFGPDVPPYQYNECANSTRGTSAQDFQTFCCDGDIRDASQSIWGWEGSFADYPLDLENLICCRSGGQLLPGGIQPLPDYTRCDPSQIRTPLASLAATNTKNAEPYLVTYEGAKGNQDGSWEDWTRTETPTCLWVQTNHPDLTSRLSEITVPVAQVTTLPPPTTDEWGYTIVTRSVSSTTSSSVEAEEDGGNSADGKTTLQGTVTRPPSGVDATETGLTQTTSTTTSGGAVNKGGMTLARALIFGSGVVLAATWML